MKRAEGAGWVLKVPTGRRGAEVPGCRVPALIHLLRLQLIYSLILNKLQVRSQDPILLETHRGVLTARRWSLNGLNIWGGSVVNCSAVLYFSY